MHDTHIKLRGITSGLTRRLTQLSLSRAPSFMSSRVRRSSFKKEVPDFAMVPQLLIISFRVLSGVST